MDGRVYTTLPLLNAKLGMGRKVNIKSFTIFDGRIGFPSGLIITISKPKDMEAERGTGTTISDVLVVHDGINDVLITVSGSDAERIIGS